MPETISDMGSLFPRAMSVKRPKERKTPKNPAERNAPGGDLASLVRSPKTRGNGVVLVKAQTEFARKAGSLPPAVDKVKF